MNDGITDIDDPRRKRLLQSLLGQLAHGPDDRLREMARAVLNNEVDLRSAALSEIYGTDLGKAFASFWDSYRSTSPEERERLITIGAAQVEGPDQRER